MSDELKSAWELAMEKLNLQNTDQVEKLSDEQKAEIADIRRKYKARVAEAEITTEGRIRAAVEQGKYEDIEVIRQQLVDERNRLNRSMESEVEKVRTSNR